MSSLIRPCLFYEIMARKWKSDTFLIFGKCKVGKTIDSSCKLRYINRGEIVHSILLGIYFPLSFLIINCTHLTFITTFL